jgi:chemotaxis protein MotB
MNKDSNTVSEITDENESAGWIVTYADMVTLLLVFFVLLYSISSLDLKKFKIAIQSIQSNLGEAAPSVALLEILDTPEHGEVKPTLEEVIGLKSREKELLEEIDEVIKEETIGDNIVVRSTEGMINIAITGKILFAPGAADLNHEANPVMAKIAMLIAQYPEYDVNIKGFTDNMPISTERFPSNWDLSAIRATTVLKFLVNSRIDPKRLTATGYGDLLPIAPNNTEDNRARNRRVEFVLEKQKD